MRHDLRPAALLGRAVIGAGLVACCLPPPAAAAAGKTTVKLATLVPDGSVWHTILEDMGSEWSAATEGRVALNIYPGGVAGDEPDTVRKMRIGQLHAATLTVAGLSEIDPAFRVFQVPMFFDSYPELFHVLDAMRPMLAARLEERGFVLLNWGHAGWVHLFSTRPVRTLDELKGLKLFVWAGDERMVQWWKSQGYRPQALAATDILTGFQTGMIEALPTTPLAALSLQWFRSTPYMMDVGFAPLVGATIVVEKQWQRISEADRAKLVAAALRTEERLEREVPAQDRRAIDEMKKRGLEVVVAATGAEELRRTAEALGKTTRGDVVEQSIFDLARRERDAFRAAQGGEQKAAP